MSIATFIAKKVVGVVNKVNNKATKEQQLPKQENYEQRSYNFSLFKNSVVNSQISRFGYIKGPI